MPPIIDPEKCNNCGLCKEKCPTQGAIIESITRHNNPAYAIDPLKCEYILGNEKEAHCVAACPEGAINIDEQKDTWAFEADGLVVATGYEPFDPAQNKRFSFHRYKNMVTAIDLEKILRNGFAYEEGGSVYFNVEKYNRDNDYGKLSGRKIEDLIKRIEYNRSKN